MFLTVACLAVGAGLGATGHLYLGTAVVIVAIVIASALKMANIDGRQHESRGGRRAGGARNCTSKSERTFAIDERTAVVAGALMFATSKLMATVALAGAIHTAAADEAVDAVQVLSMLWSGTDLRGSATHFVGDSKTFRMRVVTRNSDGTVSVATSEAPFGFLDENLDATPSATWAPYCSPQRQCIFVQCLYKRECISIVQVTSDPFYHDSRLESRGSLKRSEQGGAVKPTDADTVKRALRTLIPVNAVQPFDPLAPR